jgi:translocation and assembly module TamA
VIVNDTRSPLFNPVSGRRFSGGLSVSGGILGGLDYYTVEAGYRSYVSLGSGFVVAGRIEGGRVTTYGSTEVVPPDDRFFLGGGTTVRGYGHNQMGPKNPDGDPLGGNVMLLGSIEARITLIGSLGAVLFVDTGGVWNRADDISMSTAGLGTGMGLRYDTPFGPFRIDYGFAPTWSDGFKRGKVYIAIGQAF